MKLTEYVHLVARYTQIPCGASHDTTERVQLYRHSIDLTRDRPLLLALSVLALDRLRTAVYYIDNRPLKSADTWTAGWCSWTPWNTQSLNEHFARSTSVRGSLHLLCAASRDTVDLSCFEAKAERSCCSSKGERHRAVCRENVLSTCRGRSNTPTEHCTRLMRKDLVRSWLSRRARSAAAKNTRPRVAVSHCDAEISGLTALNRSLTPWLRRC